MAESRVTKAGTYVEIDGALTQVTAAGAYLEIKIAQTHATKAGLYVEIQQPCPGIYISEGNYTVVYGGVNMTQWITASDIEALVNVIDATNLASEFTETAPGGINWRVNCAGFISKETDDFFGKDAVSPPATMRNLNITIGHWPCTTTFTWIGTSAVGAFISNYKIGPNDPLKEGTTFRAELGISGGPDISGSR